MGQISISVDTTAEPAPAELGNLRAAAGEGVGTALLLATIVGSGIQAAELASGNEALALLANALATGAGLVALILAFGPLTGAHFNPLVTLAAVLLERMPPRRAAAYVLFQVAGAYLGVVLAHLMFGRPLVSASLHVRAGPQVLAEVVATFGLLLVVRTSARRASAAFAIAAYVTSAYWFTSSTAFANPAVTLARAATDSFAGIRAADVPAFLVAEVLGAGAAVALLAWLAPASHALRRGVMRGRSRAVEAPPAAPATPVKKVVFACVHNAGRSQMAAAFFNALADPTRARASSGGTRPADEVHPRVVIAMRELGIDLGGERPRALTSELAADVELLVTLGCGEACPSLPARARQDWPLDDPAELSLPGVRTVRDEIRRRVEALLEARGWALPEAAAGARTHP